MDSLENRYNARFKEIESLLSVGLDPEWEKLPSSFKKVNGLFEFCKEIIEATGDHALAFKPNIAFFERFGSRGLQEFELTIQHIKTRFPSAIIIADAKRGDLYNTSKEYAKYFFDLLGVDALTVNPYMGHDSLIPYIENDKGNIFILCLTSNPSAVEFQKWQDPNKNYSPGYLHQGISHLAENMNKEYSGRVGIVVGGTRAIELGSIRQMHPNLMFLIPGYGAQGGDLHQITMSVGLRSFINSSRGIHFLSSGSDFAMNAKKKAEEIHKEMKIYIKDLRSNQ